jgi:calcineurin-like phosphoesterase family protein
MGAFMQTYFTSDSHFDHKNIIQYCNRPFKNIDEMNETMVEKWNSIVTNNDTVYHLGDFTLGNIRQFTKWISQLNGNIKILPGSHDHQWLKDFIPSDKVQIVARLISVEFPEIMIGKYPQVIVMCHYSMRVWYRSYYGSWHLFGHSHGNLKGIGLSFDVGVDCTEFAPLPLKVVALKMANLTPLALEGDTAPILSDDLPADEVTGEATLPEPTRL